MIHFIEIPLCFLITYLYFNHVQSRFFRFLRIKHFLGSGSGIGRTRQGCAISPFAKIPLFRTFVFRIPPFVFLLTFASRPTLFKICFGTSLEHTK